ncbi:hypothetical protein AAHB34_16165 [Paenarthrobacter ureafaciens]
MNEDEIRAMHESVHAEYRTALAEAQWALAQANAREKVKDARIAELLNLLDQVTDPNS